MNTNTLNLSTIKYSNEELPPTKIEKILDILNDKGFGTSNEKELTKIVDRMNTQDSNEGQRCHSEQ